MRRWIPMVVLASLAVLAAGCKSATPLQACQSWSQASCQRFAECLGITDPAWVEQCVSDNAKQNGTCEQQLGQLSQRCQESFRDSLDKCSDDIGNKACSSICKKSDAGLSFCSYPCFWGCVQ